jgi:hypothetical protein
MKRDITNGRILGSSFEFTNFEEDENYTDQKVNGSLLFPKHNSDQSSPVTTYFLTPEELATLRNK